MEDEATGARCGFFDLGTCTSSTAATFSQLPSNHRRGDGICPRSRCRGSVHRRRDHCRSRRDSGNNRCSTSAASRRRTRPRHSRYGLRSRPRPHHSPLRGPLHNRSGHTRLRRCLYEEMQKWVNGI